MIVYCEIFGHNVMGLFSYFETFTKVSTPPPATSPPRLKPNTRC